MTSPLRVSGEVREALDDDRPIVALESTVYSRLGLPDPANREALERCMAAIRGRDAVAAITAVVDGVACIGLEPPEIERVLAADRKIAERDLGVAIASDWPVGATTVSASLALAAAAGISVFATGGIGGVHRGAEHSGDVSADLPALALHRVVTVCAGAKAFLDLGRTLEDLETRSVPVLGWDTDELPAFYTPTSGLRVPHRVSSAAEVADIHRSRRALGATGGELVCVPPPANDALDHRVVIDAIERALDDAGTAGVRGAAVTPLVLERIAAATAGGAVRANVALVANNAAVAADIAVALAT